MRSRTSIAAAATVATALAALTLLPVYADLAWLPVTWGAVLVVGVVAQSSRLLGIPAVLSPVLALGGLAAYITSVFARGVALLGFVPGKDARSALAAMTREGWHEISVLHAPVPTGRSLILLTAAGVGLVAIAVDAIAVAMRRASLAGIPLLALFAVSAASVPHGVGWLPFVYAGAGYLLLLLTDSADRIRQWGHPLGLALTRRPADGPAPLQTAPMTVVGRRVGFAAIAVAVAVPAAIPGLHAGLFGTNGGHGPGFGKSSATVTTYNPILRIHDDLTEPTRRPLLRYLSSDPDPAYLRMTALDEFDNTGWTQADLTAPSSHRVSKGIPDLADREAAVPTVSIQARIEATKGFAVRWLPVPFPSTAVAVDRGDWRWDGTSGAIFSTETTTSGRVWATTSERILATRSQLVHQVAVGMAPGLQRDLVLPPGSTPEVVFSLARSVTKNATTPFTKALALQEFFHSSQFHYDLNAPAGDSAQVITEFLKNGHGYCVQFATTMALMARVLGIPARVAIGFTRGARQHDGSYEVTTADAHAWPELYFGGLGWLAFEPTPRGDGQAEVPAYTQLTPSGPAANPSSANAQPTPQPAAASPTPNTPGKLQHLDPGTATLTKSRGHTGATTTIALVAFALLVLLASPGLARTLARRRRWAGAETDAARVHAAWRELGDDARDLGYRWQPADSPRRSMTRLIAATGLQETTTQLFRLTTAEEHARYARSFTVATDLTEDTRAVRRELGRLAGLRRRWAAVLMPRSTVRATLSFLANRIADVFDLVDLALAFVYRLFGDGLRSRRRGVAASAPRSAP